MNLALLAAIVVLTVAELVAVVVVSLWGPHDQTSALIAVLIGIVGPIVASLVAVVHAASASAEAKAATQRVDQVERTQAAQTQTPPGGAT